MAQEGQLIVVTSVDSLNFTENIAENAAELEHFEIAGIAKGLRQGRVKSLIVWSSENNAWDIAFYRRRDPRSADPNEDAFLGVHVFTAASGLQVGAAGLYRYFVSGLDIRLRDDEDTGQIHVELINRSAGAKVAYGLGGHFRVEIVIEPTMGW